MHDYSLIYLKTNEKDYENEYLILKWLEQYILTKCGVEKNWISMFQKEAKRMYSNSHNENKHLATRIGKLKYTSQLKLSKLKTKRKKRSTYSQ